MFTTHVITDLDHPALARYRSLRESFSPRAGRVFVAEGEKVVRRLTETPLVIHSMLLPEKWRAEYEARTAPRTERVEIFVGTMEMLERITGFPLHQGLFAVADVPSCPSVESLQARLPSPRLLVATDGLTSAENVGCVARNAAAFGAQALLSGETSCSPWLRRAMRASMGTLLNLPVVECGSLADALRTLRSAGVRCLAAHPRPGASVLADADLRGDVCLVFGAENDGPRAEVLAACDGALIAPMAPGVDSLNVGSAAAAFLHEAWRQRR